MTIRISQRVKDASSPSKVCSQCHGLDVVAEQQLDLDGWKMTVDQMASMGADATEAQLDQIVHYLAKAFPESK